MTTLRPAPLDRVRHAIAAAVVRDRASMPTTLGAVTLRPEQRDAAARLVSLIAMNGGAMLAEPVGLGKTYTALAVAASMNENILIAVPAALRGMWAEALRECAMSAALVSHEALSRGAVPACSPGLVIVDEAHRFRAPNTRRYAAAADLCRRAKVLLVTATPVQNRRDDLAAQLALFLGRATEQMSDGELARHVVRDSPREVAGQPRLDGPHTLVLPRDDDCLDALLSLPPPIPATDESLAVTLMTYGLVHQWTSSRAALVAALERRRARGLALIAAAESGRTPTRAELSAWTHAGDSLQLAFPELVVAEPDTGGVALDALAAALDAHDAALRDLLRRLRSGADPDEQRAAALRRVRAAHSGERIIAFCHYTETVNALRRYLAADDGVVALTAHGARVAGGRASRDAVLAQFTPGGRPPGRAEHMSLLITTDLLSEGLNLQEASVIVHLDLPWNPARLEQRVGRARRLGSRHDAVTVYVVAPPAAAERMLGIERRLRDKLDVARRAIGVAGPVLPSISPAPGAAPGFAEEIGALSAELRAWIGPGSCPAGGVAAVRAAQCGFLALVHGGAGARLIADLGGGIETGTSAIRRAVAACNGREVSVSTESVVTIERRIYDWIDARRGADAVGVGVATSTSVRRDALARIAKTLAAAPRHRRGSLGVLVEAARRAVTAPMGEGAERVLDALVASLDTGERWLESVAELAELDLHPSPVTGDAFRLVALIVMQPSGVP